MPPVLSVIGKKNSGKTTLIEKIIVELNRLGYTVGTIKHHVHEFAMDIPGKDTWRHKRAGAKTVALSAPGGLGIICSPSEDTSPAELLFRYFTDVDLVLAEGYKQSALPKIEVFRSAVHATPLQTDETLVAMVVDLEQDRDVPQFALDDMTGLGSFLVNNYIRPAAAQSPPPQAAAVSFCCDGEPFSLAPSQEKAVQHILDVLQSLLKNKDWQDISISRNKTP